jgi:uncharacterized membrane protein
MSTRSWAFTDDLPNAAIAVVLVLVVLALGLLALELGRRERWGVLIFSSGLVATLFLGAAVLRPVRVTERGSMVGPRVVVLFDASRRLSLPADDTTRRARGITALEGVRKRYSEARLGFLAFGRGAPTPLPEDPKAIPLVSESDLGSAIAELAAAPGERPTAVIVVSDGRLSRPDPSADDESIRRTLGAMGIPIHSVRLAEKGPNDASIRAVRAAGAAVAHQPLSLTIEVGCSPDLDCGNVPVAVRELRQGVEPAVLASGTAKVEDGTATLELRITLERAGTRVVEVSIDAPQGDLVPENNSRLIPFSVARERIRMLHVAGRPTYDVRTLRMWLKSDESVDLVSFFILRSTTDDPQVDDENTELALIPFPVDELFTEHLPSFDAVVLQDIDAVAYKLDRHLPSLARYVESGGGLIMVGGQSSFAGGNYAQTALDAVLPVEIPDDEQPFDTVEFSPTYTPAGRAAPVLGALRDLLGEDIPSMTGSNTLGVARPGSIVLLEHPNRKAGATKMPILALGEAGDGRSIALGVDGSWRLSFSSEGAKVAGRAFGALWDGLLGWLMRDPRFEPGRAELIGECVAGEPVAMNLTRLPGATGEITIDVERLGRNTGAPLSKKLPEPPPGPVRIELGKLEPGGYTAKIKIGQAPPTRLDFACEKGGEAWSDSRPDPDRLERIAKLTNGRSVTFERVSDLPLPESARISAERHVTPLLPPWAWTALAAVFLGAHWFVRRRGGLV